MEVVRRHRRDSLGLLRDLVRDYGNVVNLRLGTRSVYLVNKPALIHAVLVSGHRQFIKSAGLQLTRGLLGEGLPTSEGALHRHRRHLLQPYFQPRAVARWAQTVSELAAAGAAHWMRHPTLRVSPGARSGRTRRPPPRRAGGGGRRRATRRGCRRQCG